MKINGVFVNNKYYQLMQETEELKEAFKRDEGCYRCPLCDAIHPNDYSCKDDPDSLFNCGGDFEEFLKRNNGEGL